MEGSDMTPLDGFLMIAGFAWGCLPFIEGLIERRSPGFRRSPQKLAPSPWIWSQNQALEISPAGHPPAVQGCPEGRGGSKSAI